ncbi:hypothetical protein LTR56_023072, partial [Elasticomyces elasticus]
MGGRVDWWPDKSDDTVRRGLKVTFSNEPEKPVPRIWEYERLYGGTNRRERVWSRNATSRHRTHRDSFGRLPDASLRDSSNVGTVERANKQTITSAPPTPSKTSEHVEMNHQLSAGDAQAAAHLWRSADQSVAEYAANDARSPGPIETRPSTNKLAKDARCPIVSHNGSAAIDASLDSHCTFTTPEAARTAPSLPSDLQREPETAAELSQDQQVLVSLGRRMSKEKAIAELED